MVKALSFKGDKKPHKKRKREHDVDDPSSASKQLVTSSANVGAQDDDDETWVSAEAVTDISGPVLLVLNTEPVTAIACDQFGKVFASKIENMVEGLPGSAEPHDVRQVFVATRTVGSEEQFSFKAHHGRYLGCDKLGKLSSLSEAISPEETFTCKVVPGHAEQFTIQTSRSTYLHATSDEEAREIRGDAEESDELSHIRFRIQARFKPQLKTEKAEKVRAKVSRKELEDEVGRRLDEDEVKKLKKARRDGNYHEVMLDVKVKGKHDKFA